MSPDLRRWRRSRREFLKRMGRVGGVGIGALALSACQPPAPSATAPAAPAAGTTPAVAAATSSAAVAAPKRGGTLKIAFHLPAATLDPHQNASQGIHNPLGFASSRLVRFKTGPSTAQGQLVVEPDLAESWETPDDKTYVFKLRQGARFHNVAPVNGREVTAEDIKYTFQRLMSEPASPQRSLFEQVAAIDATDKYSVKFTLKSAFAPFLNYLASPYTWIVARELVDSGEIKNKIVGTGPFVLQDYTPNVSMTFKRNPDYYFADQVNLDEIQWLVIPDDSTRHAALRTKEFDIDARALPRTDFEILKAAVPDIQSAEYPSTTWSHIYFRTDQPEKPFSKQKVRQAMSLALDRKAMNDVIFQGKAELEGPMMAQLVDWVVPVDQLGAGSKYFTRDLAAAKQLLGEAGYPNGFAMDFWSSQGLGSFYTSFFEMMKSQLAEVGIEATLRWQDFNTFVSTTNTGKYEDAGGGGWSPVTDPDEHLSKAFYSKGGRNTSHLNDPTLDQMILKQQTTTDLAERKKQVGDIQRYLAEQQYYLTLVGERSIFAWHPYVKGYWPHILIGQAEVGRAWLDR